MSIFLMVIALPLLVSFLLTALFRRYALRQKLLDHPNERSSHTHPTPRGGGIVFVVLWLFACALFPYLGLAPEHSFILFGFPVLVLAILGYCDDLYNLSAKLRLAVQMAAAVLFLYALKQFEQTYFHGWLMTLGGMSILLIIFAIVWSTNLYNFMDGTDGIAAIEAIFVYGVGGLLLWFSGAYLLAYLAWTLVALVTGFLVLNWPRARIFMGDVGSSFLGFLIVPFAVVGYFKYDLSVFAWLILYLVFAMDATLTLLRRLWHREKIYEAHKLHAYQRLHQAGYSHCQVLYVVITLNSVLALIASIVSLYTDYLSIGLVLGVMVYFIFYGFVEYVTPQKTREIV